MKITTYGTVTISDEGIKINGFSFDAEGGSFNDCVTAALNWALGRVDFEQSNWEISDGGGNVVNGRLGLPPQR